MSVNNHTRRNKCFIFLSFLFFIQYSYCQNKTLDTLKIFNVIKSNSLVKPDVFKSSDFKILNWTVYSPDSINIVFQLISNKEWEKEHYAFKYRYAGFYCPSKVLFTYNGYYNLALMNYNYKWVTQSGKIINNKLDGQVVGRSDDHLSYIEHYKEGKKNGSNIIYFGEDNTVSQVYIYSMDTLNGTSFQFYKNSQIKEECEYKKGIQNGAAKSYYENGNLESKSFYNAGNLEGEYISYYDNGNIKSTGFYSGDYVLIRADCDTCKEFKIIYFNSKGENINLIEDKKISIEFKIALSTAAREWKSGKFKKFFLKKGIWLYYDESGKLLKKEVYKKNGDLK